MEIYSPPKAKATVVIAAGNICPSCQAELGVFTVSSKTTSRNYFCKACGESLVWRFRSLVCLPFDLSLLIFVVSAASFGFSKVFIDSGWWLIPLLAVVALGYWSINTLSKLVLIKFCKLKHYV